MQFSLSGFDQDYSLIKKKRAQGKMAVVNMNLVKLPRSESLDNIIEKLNEYYSGISMKRFQDQQILNWFTLKFNDRNKEIEYQEMRNFEKIFKFRKLILITLAFNGLEIIKDITLSSLDKIPFDSFWFYFAFTLIALFSLIASYKFKKYMPHVNLSFFVFLCTYYSFCYFSIENVEFSLFTLILLYIFSLHGTYVRLIILVASCFLIMHINIVNSNFKRMDSDYSQRNFEKRP
jgi:hypothetical protein